jgi:hypothetical protein
LKHFQHQGVKATQEVQAAGRRVAEENKRLRCLLRLHGVTDTEIEEFLNSKNDDTSHGGSPILLPLQAVAIQQMKPSCGETDKDCLGSLAAKHPYPQRDLPLREESRPVSDVERLPTNIEDVANSDAFQTTSPRKTLEAPVTVPSADDSLRSDESTIFPRSHSPGGQGEMTSCEAAARIIAGIRGYHDVSDAKEELGCTTNECAVRNTVLFEILDR